MHKTSIEIENKVCELYEKTNLTQKEIAEQINIHRLTVRKILNRNEINSKDNRISINENYFDKIDTPNKAYWLGFITGDGCIRYTGGSLNLTIGLNPIDNEILEKFIIDTESKHEIKLYKRYHPDYDNYHDISILKIYRPKMCEDLIKHGTGIDKSRNLKLPKICDTLIRYYLRGIIDADGGWCINNTKDLNMIFNFIGPVRDFIIDFRNLLMKKCYLSKSKIYKCPGSWRITYGGNNQTKRIFKYLYDDVGPVLERKFHYTKTFFNNHGDENKFSKKSQLHMQQIFDLDEYDEQKYNIKYNSNE